MRVGLFTNLLLSLHYRGAAAGLSHCYFGFVQSRRLPAVADAIRYTPSVVAALCLTSAMQAEVRKLPGPPLLECLLSVVTDPRCAPRLCLAAAAAAAAVPTAAILTSRAPLCVVQVCLWLGGSRR